ncbi:MAG: DUF4157 domain-containing protein [Myxococcales bacterium]|nr:DUF4157 domain-containing protein [Myxococcales bacterium]
MLQRKSSSHASDSASIQLAAAPPGKQTLASASGGPGAEAVATDAGQGPALAGNGERNGERIDDWKPELLGAAMGLGGEPLPAAQQTQFERSLNTNLADVRLHTGQASAQAAENLGARAFTSGRDIHFGAGEYQPGSSAGMHLLAHEVAHTAQQGGQPGAQAKLSVSSPGDALETEADNAADAMVRGAPAQVSSAPGISTIQRSVRTAVSGARTEARTQHEARGNNPDPGPGSGPTQSFSDMGREDHGPAIRHDHGHMQGADGNFDPSLHQDPTMADRWELAKWIAKLELAEALRPDLVDGTSAYRHFLQGNGATRDIRYPRFIANDASGHVVLQSALDDARDAAIRRHDADVGTNPQPGSHSYHLRTDTITVGGDSRYPYPATENWQKAIGGHTIWIEANVTVVVRAPEGTPANSCPVGGYERVFHVEMTIHAEDMYNFNPEAHDIATGVPDSANGRFEITGLGHEFLSTGTYARTFDFTTTMEAAPPPGTAGTGPTVDTGRAPREGRPSAQRNYPTSR